jgi:hypothetical protein
MAMMNQAAGDRTAGDIGRLLDLLNAEHAKEADATMPRNGTAITGVPPTYIPAV